MISCLFCSQNSNLFVFGACLVFNRVTDWNDIIVMTVLVTSLFRFKTCHRAWHGGRKGFGEVECVQPSKRPKRRKVTRRPTSTQATTTAGAKIASQTERTRERNDSQNNAKWHQVEEGLKNKQYQVAWLLRSDPVIEHFKEICPRPKTFPLPHCVLCPVRWHCIFYDAVSDTIRRRGW